MARAAWPRPIHIKRDVLLRVCAVNRRDSRINLVISPAHGGHNESSYNAKTHATVPIVMANAPDPVGSGLIKSLVRPGGNITGLTYIANEVSPKLLELLLTMLPKLTRVAVLVDPRDSSHAVTLKSVQGIAQRIRVKILPVEARTPQDIETIFPVMVREKVGAVLVVSGGLFNQQMRQITELATKNRLPSISYREEYAEAGGLMCYGPSSADQLRRAAIACLNPAQDFAPCTLSQFRSERGLCTEVRRGRKI